MCDNDMMWSAALITDSKLLERKVFPNTHKDEFLYDLIEYGVMDRMEGEPRNASEEKSMRYAAVCSSFVYDHVVNLEQKVGSLPWYLFVWSDKAIPSRWFVGRSRYKGSRPVSRIARES